MVVTTETDSPSWLCRVGAKGPVAPPPVPSFASGPRSRFGQA
jgi:hypothetical protein